MMWLAVLCLAGALAWGPSGVLGKTVRADTAVADVTFVAFDIETTGLNPHKDRVVELAAVKFRGGRIIDERSWLVDPGRRIPPWVAEVHGIGNDMVRGRPAFHEIYDEFTAFAEGAVLIAHNARFDVAFINKEAERAGVSTPSNEVIDSLALFRKWFPEADSHSLKGVAQHVRIEHGRFHRAGNDSKYLAQIFRVGLDKLADQATLQDLYGDAGGALAFWQDAPVAP
jgi:DNA polymerase-3 subunit alpha (Gram-positive type)